MAQNVPMGVPLPTTMLLEKPAPDATFDGKQMVEMGVQSQSYKFVLKDAHVDDLSAARCRSSDSSCSRRSSFLTLLSGGTTRLRGCHRHCSE